MRNARIVDQNGNFIVGEDGRSLIIPSSRFAAGEDAKAYLERLQEQRDLTELQYCCSHGNCKAPVHFRKGKKKTAGRSSLSTDPVWISNDLEQHGYGCPVPHQESHIHHLPHNGLSLSNAANTYGEMILFHLNMDLGISPKEGFNGAALSGTNDREWRQAHGHCHSYFAISSLSDLSKAIATVFREAGKEGLQRIHVAHEGTLLPLKDFIVRNKAEDRMKIIDCLRYKADLRARHSIGASDSSFIFGRPYILFFEAAQTADMAFRRDGNSQRVNGWRYELQDGSGRKVYDQLNLQKTGYTVGDFSSSGALVLARPGIPVNQNPEYPMLIWSIQGPDNVQFEPPKEVVKMLCWHGPHIPFQRRQKRLALG